MLHERVDGCIIKFRQCCNISIRFGLGGLRFDCECQDVVDLFAGIDRGVDLYI